MHEYCLCGGFFQPEPDPDDPGAGGVRGPGAASTSGGGNGHNRYGGQGRERRAEGFGSRVGDDEVTPLERMPTTWQVERRRRRALEAAREERLQRLRQGVCGYAAVLIWRIWEAFTGRDSVDNELLPSEYFSEEDAQLTPVQMGAYARMRTTGTCRHAERAATASGEQPLHACSTNLPEIAMYRCGPESG